MAAGELPCAFFSTTETDPAASTLPCEAVNGSTTNQALQQAFTEKLAQDIGLRRTHPLRYGLNDWSRARKHLSRPEHTGPIGAFVHQA